MTYWKLCDVNLNWDQIDQDLKQYQQDTVYLNSFLEHTKFSQTWQDSLYDIAQQYRQYGYNEHNTRIWKSTSDVEPIWFRWQEDLLNQLPLDKGIVCLTRQDPGQVIPWHQDNFFMLRRLYPQDHRTIVRVLLFMEDWKNGQLLQIGDEFLHHWQRGEVYIWKPDTWHLAGNVGYETKWTCNITGFVNDPELVKLLT